MTGHMRQITQYRISEESQITLSFGLCLDLQSCFRRISIWFSDSIGHSHNITRLMTVQDETYQIEFGNRYSYV